jgi:hypothetical protein
VDDVVRAERSVGLVQGGDGVVKMGESLEPDLVLQGN